MSTYIVTGNYTASAMKGMLANSSDREAAVRPLVEGSGGKLNAYYATTGDTDFLMIVETDELQGMIAALMVAGASESVSNLKTVLAFSSAEFMAAQSRAGTLLSSFKASNQT